MLTVMDTPTPDFLMRELLPLLRQFCVGPYGIAIGGSYAKGSHDALSDVDVYLFAQQVRSGLQRNKLVVEALGETTAPVFWDAKIPSLKVGPTSHIKVAGWNAGCVIHDRSRVRLHHVDRE